MSPKKQLGLALLETQLPGSWVLHKREETNYGLDCLMEIVEEEGPLAGQSAWLQLIVKNRIRWQRDGTYTVKDIGPTADAYWRRNNGPVFIVLVDLAEGEIYFLCKEHFVKRHFDQYLEDASFAYYIDKAHNRLDTPEGVKLFAAHLEKQNTRRCFECEVTTFLTCAEQFAEIVDYPLATDQHAVATIRRNYTFLCDYFHIERLPGQFYEKLIAEQRRNLPTWSRDLFRVVKLYHDKEREILYCIDAHLKQELAYWSITNAAFYYYVYSLTRKLLTVRGRLL